MKKQLIQPQCYRSSKRQQNIISKVSQRETFVAYNGNRYQVLNRGIQLGSSKRQKSYSATRQIKRVNLRQKQLHIHLCDKQSIQIQAEIQKRLQNTQTIQKIHSSTPAHYIKNTKSQQRQQQKFQQKRAILKQEQSDAFVKPTNLDQNQHYGNKSQSFQQFQQQRPILTQKQLHTPVIHPHQLIIKPDEQLQIQQEFEKNQDQLHILTEDIKPTQLNKQQSDNQNKQVAQKQKQSHIFAQRIQYLQPQKLLEQYQHQHYQSKAYSYSVVPSEKQNKLNFGEALQKKSQNKIYQQKQLIQSEKNSHCHMTRRLKRQKIQNDYKQSSIQNNLINIKQHQQHQSLKKQGIKRQKSVFHNFLKHLMLTLKQVISLDLIKKYSTQNYNAQLLAIKLWRKVKGSKKWTKKLLLILFGAQSQTHKVQSQLRRFIKDGKDYTLSDIQDCNLLLRKVVLSELNTHENIQNCFEKRKIENLQYFKVYLKQFLQELANNGLKNRFPKEKKPVKLKSSKQQQFIRPIDEVKIQIQQRCVLQE